MLRITTCGSVDDGKSTLIGRLLYDTRSVPADRILAMETASRRKGLDFTDFSLLTDGLIAEREQGITIDVAHIYFDSGNRKYIIADAPGHVEYTRNMITGASKAQAAVILVDVRNGVKEQTHRHLHIARLLRIPHIAICVNKMDLLGYNQTSFDKVRQEVLDLGLEEAALKFIPVAALWGDNVVRPSDNMPWYQGPTLLEWMEGVRTEPEEDQAPGRFVVQAAIRHAQGSDQDYRAYAGRVLSGVWAPGQRVVSMPGGQEATIAAIERFDKSLDSATTGHSVRIVLDRDIQLSRGDMLAEAEHCPPQLPELEAEICWLDQSPGVAGATYLLQHQVKTTRCRIESLHIADKSVSSVQTNDFALARLRTAQPLPIDPYGGNKANGAFILIDPRTNNTVAVGFRR